MEEMYRQAASILVFRPTNLCTRDGCGLVYQLLLLHKPRKRDEWQLPQGGKESGEDTTQAALRELQEEAGLRGEIFGASSLFYQYDFPSSYRQRRPDHIRGQRIEFVFGRVLEDALVTVDRHEIDGYAWVVPEQLPLYLKRKEYLSTVQELYEEGTGLLGSAKKMTNSQ